MEECHLALAMICAGLTFLFRKARRGAIFKKLWNRAMMDVVYYSKLTKSIGRSF